MSEYTNRTHSVKIRTLFKIRATGVDILIRKKKSFIGIEVKETYGKVAKYQIKNKDMVANYFLFYYPPQNLFLLAYRRDLPFVDEILNTTTITHRRVRELAFFSTTEDARIVAEVNRL